MGGGGRGSRADYANLAAGMAAVSDKDLEKGQRDLNFFFFWEIECEYDAGEYWICAG